MLKLRPFVCRAITTKTTIQQINLLLAKCPHARACRLEAFYFKEEKIRSISILFLSTHSPWDQMAGRNGGRMLSTKQLPFHWLWWPNFQTALPLWILNRWIVRHKQTYVNCKWSDSLSFSCPFGRSLIFRNFSCQFQVKLLLLWFFFYFKYKILAFFSLFKHNVYFIHAITWTMCSIARRTLIFCVCARTLLINFQWPLSLSLFEWRQWPVKM